MNKILTTLLITGLLLLTAISASAQTNNPEPPKRNALAEFKRRMLEHHPAAPESVANEDNLTAQRNAELQADAQSENHDGSEQAKKALVGSWLRKIHAPDGDPLTDFLGLVTFHDDGTLTSETQIDITTDPPFITTDAHGVWQHRRGRTFDVTFVSLVVDLKGNLLATAKLNQRITLGAHGDSYSSRFTIEFTDPDGNKFSLAPGTEEGTRIKVEPIH